MAGGGRVGVLVLVGTLVIALAACVLPSPLPSPAVLATSRFNDPVGDAPLDLVATTTIATAEAVRFEFEFATDFGVPGAAVSVLFGLSGGAETVCNGYAKYIATVPAIGPVPSGETWAADLRNTFDEVVAPLEATISPRLVTVTVPLDQIEDPQVLYFAVLVFTPPDVLASTPDHSPDEWDEAACHAAPLTEEAVESPSAAAPPVLVTTRFSDPVGDGTPDLVAITTVATAEELTFGFEFADEVVQDASTVGTVIADPAAFASPVCDGYVGPYVVLGPFYTTLPDGSPTVTAMLQKSIEYENRNEWDTVADLDATISGNRGSVTVPLSMIGKPTAIHFAVLSDDLEGEGLVEHSPDWPSPDRSEGACHTAPLTPEESPGDET